MSDVSRDAAARNHYGIRAARSQLYGNGGDACTGDVRKMLSTSESELLYFELLARGISIAACREEETRDNCNFSKYIARYLFITGEMGGAGYKQISRRDLRGSLSLSLSRKSSRLISPFISHGNRVDPSARIYHFRRFAASDSRRLRSTGSSPGGISRQYFFRQRFYAL